MTQEEIKTAKENGTLIESSHDASNWVVFGTMKNSPKRALKSLALCHGARFYRIADKVYKSKRVVLGRTAKLNYSEVN